EVAEPLVDAGEELALLAAGGAGEQRRLALLLHRVRGGRLAGPALEGGHVAAALVEDAGARAARGLGVGRAERSLDRGLGAGADEAVADALAVRVPGAGGELAGVVGPAGGAVADEVDEGVALLDLGVELR